MPTIAENLESWSQYDWTKKGDEWSQQFGGTEALWSLVLYPRIKHFLPARRVLEVAPGYGRCTQFLLPLCQSLVGIDICENCVQHCQARFAAARHAQFRLNDGVSLAAVPDGSVDFAFSFDSLVHAEKDVLEGYLSELRTKLSVDGVGFFHHSNLGSYPGRLALVKKYHRLPSRIRGRLLREDQVQRLLSINLNGWRAESMTAGLFREYCERAGLVCLTQELISWFSGTCLIDAFSVFARKCSRWEMEFACVKNHAFVENARLSEHVAQFYDRYRRPTGGAQRERSSIAQQ